MKRLFGRPASALFTAAIVHWNAVYLHRAVQYARALGAAIPDDLLVHVPPAQFAPWLRLMSAFPGMVGRP